MLEIGEVSEEERRTIEAKVAGAGAGRSLDDVLGQAKTGHAAEAYRIRSA
jgi:heat-inducible transcriptional repressor